MTSMRLATIEIPQERLRAFCERNHIRKLVLFGSVLCDDFSDESDIFLDSLPSKVLNRAPTPKQRMRVLKRDSLHCKICGRSPNDYTDIELHVHHIRPWGHSGLTHDDNLITLCHTCHKGLDPHEDWYLYDLIEVGFGQLDVNATAQDYWEGVRCYRKLAHDKYVKLLHNKLSQGT